MSFSVLVKLHNGVRMPLLGLGTYLMKPHECLTAIPAALSAGCRLVDTGSVYRNEEAIGEALRKFSEASPEEELGSRTDSTAASCDVWVQTKAGTSEMGYENVVKAFERSRQRLGVELIDLYMLHWPGSSGKSPQSSDLQSIRLESWKACEDLYKSGKVRAIGVSNYMPHHLDQLAADGGEITPMVNQIEVHPDCPADNVVSYCQSRGIVVQAYSPLGTAKSGLVGREAVRKAAQTLNATPAQALLLWHLTRNIATIPKSTSAAHIAENFGALRLLQEMSQDQAETLDRMMRAAGCGNERRYCWDPRGVH